MYYFNFNGKEYSINDVLQLNNDFSEKNIKTQYRILVKENHPDNFKENKEEYEEKVKLINFAFKEAKKYIQNGNINEEDINVAPAKKEKKDAITSIEVLCVIYKETISKFKNIIEQMEILYKNNSKKLNINSQNLFKIIIDKYTQYYNNLTSDYAELFKIYKNGDNYTVEKLNQIHNNSIEDLRKKNTDLYPFFRENCFKFISCFSDFYKYSINSADDIFSLVCANNTYDKIYSSICKKNNLELEDESRLRVSIKAGIDSSFNISNLVNANLLNQIMLKNKLEKIINNFLETNQKSHGAR